MRGDPLEEVQRYSLSEEASARMDRLSGEFKKSGVIAFPDLLDGDGYFIEWRTSGERVRLALGNPLEFRDDKLNAFVRQAEDFLSTAWAGAPLRHRGFLRRLLYSPDYR